MNGLNTVYRNLPNTESERLLACQVVLHHGIHKRLEQGGGLLLHDPFLAACLFKSGTVGGKLYGSRLGCCRVA